MPRWCRAWTRRACWPPDIPDPVLLDWFRTGHAGLVSALETAAPDLACWTFLPGAASALAFWARRQVHETTVHRIDVQLAAAAAGDWGSRRPGQPGPGGARPARDPVPAALAADGIDELLMGFARRGARHGPLSDPARGLFIGADASGLGADASGLGAERRAGVPGDRPPGLASPTGGACGWGQSAPRWTGAGTARPLGQKTAR